MSKKLSPEQKRRMEQHISMEESLLQQLKEAHEKGEYLRFNQPCLKASVIAEQFYCEKKVEMEHLHGRIETETKLQGSEGHESLLVDSVEVERSEILQKIFSDEPVIVHEMPLLAKYGDVILAGQPDAIIFKDGTPIVLFEYKFSNSPLPYKSYHVQARIYGRILEGMGFDTSDLFYTIAVAPRASRGNEELFRKVIKAVNENGPNEASLKINDANVYIYEYNQPDAERDIDWALDFWKGSRDAIPADNPNKCRNCEYRDMCSCALVYTKQ